MLSLAAGHPANSRNRKFTQQMQSLARRHALCLLVLLFCSIAALRAAAQAAAQPDQTSQAPKPAGSAQQVPPVTTTVVVHGNLETGYEAPAVDFGNLNGALVPLREIPLSVSVTTRGLLYDTQARVLADVIKNDASVGEDYAPVGYYGDFQIRGFPLDLATALQINGMTIAGEQDVPLENKERVEFVKGVAGLESGVASAGGVVNYVTKRPAVVKAIDLATDHRGSAYGALDLGHLFGSQKQVGARANLAGERIASYVNGANGWRGVGAGALDWKLNPNAIWKNDFEYQHKTERSVCGYQLLGGTVVPDLKRISPSTMLGEQSWQKPNIFDTFNARSRFDYDLPQGWRLFAAGSFSHSLIDDNVVYAYGNSIADPSYFFAPDGTYDIYDYRDPNELRIDAQAELMIVGHVRTGVVSHDIAAGGVFFRRSVQQPGYYTVENPVSPDGVIQDGAVYGYIGSENIYQPLEAFPGAANENGVRQLAGPQRLWENNHQSALVIQDRIGLPGRIQLLAGGRYDSLRDNNYSLQAGDPTADAVVTDKKIWLPQFAVSIRPTEDLMIYSSYSVLLSLGPQSPWWVDNSSQFLGPYFTRQAEIGAKYDLGQRLLLTGALFRMRAPFFYPKALQSPDSACNYNYAWDADFAPGDLCFESEGRETHDGIELNAQGKAARWLQLSGSAAAIRAISNDTGTPEFDNKQVLNVPHLHTALFADILVPHAHGLHVMPGWSYTGRKEATRDDAVSVPGYNLFNLGARYAPGGENGRVTFRLYADNIANKRYWKDTGASLGDTFIHLGAPTTVRLSAHYTF